MKRRLVLLLIAVLAIKAIFLALDSQPSFHLGGSAVYLATAIGKWIPPDRGFVYGFLLRPLAVWPRSLTPMVLMQAGLSAIASWLVGVCLVRYFASGFMIAALCAVACAIEPLQLTAERCVSAESIATFVFAVFLLAAFSYLKTSTVSTLALVQILGALLITLRLSFLPLVLSMSVVLPVLSRRAISFWRSSRRFGINWINGLRFILVPLLVSVILSQTLLFAYRHLYGELLNKPPAYAYGGTNRSLTRPASTYAEYFDINGLKSSLATRRRAVRRCAAWRNASDKSGAWNRRPKTEPYIANKEMGKRVAGLVLLSVDFAAGLPRVFSNKLAAHPDAVCGLRTLRSSASPTRNCACRIPKAALSDHLGVAGVYYRRLRISERIWQTSPKARSQGEGDCSDLAA